MKENEKNRIDEHDMTKKMMETIRAGFNKVLKEAREDNVIDLPPSDADYQADLKGLEVISTSAVIDTLRVYPKDDNVIMTASIPPGINLTFNKNAGEPKIEMSGLNDVNSTFTEMVSKLEGHYTNWCNEWGIKLKQEPYTK